MNEHQPQPSIEDIIETLHAARDVCIRYEKKYKMLSEQFYALYSKGLLDDDGLNFDFVDWAGSYKTVLACHREYDEQTKQSTLPEKLAQLKAHVMVTQ